jgi:hypothetical protein
MALTKVQPEMMMQLTPAIMPTGSVIQTATVKLTGGESLSVNNANAGSTTWTASSLNITITPIKTNSKFLLMADIKYASNDMNAVYRIYDVTASANVEAVAAGNRVATEGGAIGGNGQPMGNGAFNAYGTTARNTTVFYSPASPSATRQFRIDFIGVNNAGTVYHGRNSDTTDAAYNSYSPCSLTVMEIAA